MVAPVSIREAIEMQTGEADTLTIKKGTMAGFFDPFGGAGGPLDI